MPGLTTKPELQFKQGGRRMAAKIKRGKHAWIILTEEDGGSIQTQKVEAHILLAILEKLEEIRCGLIDIENSQPSS